MAQEAFTIKIETSFGGTTIRSSDVLGKSGPPSVVSDLIQSIIRPRITIVSPLGTKTIQEHGAPSPIIGLAVVLGAVFLAVAIVKMR